MDLSASSILKSLVRMSIGRLFYQSRVDHRGSPSRMRPILGQINRGLIERGINPPWILSKEECLSFWASKYNREREKQGYIEKPSGIPQLLSKMWTLLITKDDILLELGSGTGYNLAQLYQNNYHKLIGIDINPIAIENMKRLYPDCYANSVIYSGDISDLLLTMAANSVDVIFTVAVAQSIHPSDNQVFRDMVRVARKYICVVEGEVANCSYIFARNYQRVFEGLGCWQIKTLLITKDISPNISRDYDGYRIRLFNVGKEIK